ncbi:TlyA family RNA methyltransferase [Lederbergia galactosidilytica]|uniref:RNA methyltransferase n=1 Tax=Lederbergia galactosidilytica TaxID=217031 RepID=A0A0Q9Y5L0_9BACI|nr:TlyA family RNA methyltransferase [Lederbergia galactosidilytica]KRG08719.1 RNA methyltransferase [Virgibacillus soli]KRG12222.1 RNA methyltransferase [Lederbergia galactosidilytica]OAK75309.1 RNA methyltransferase [Lederbergia galactosidilytica]
MKIKKQRLDVLLVERGLVETREKAKRTIMAGLVFSNETRLDKPGEKIAIDLPLQVKGNPLPYVSRGGLKLEKALAEFRLTVKDKVMLDIGASTGGFTDCALQNGAKMVYALDVGYNQLAWKLRNDPRVVVMERTNFRYVKPENLDGGMPSFATIDVSFISLTLILPVLKGLLTPESDVIALIKPQFEAGREEVGKKGIVREKTIHVKVVDKIKQFSLQQGYDIQNVSFSPITGGEGNIEFLIHLSWSGFVNQNGSGSDFSAISTIEVVEQAHNQFGK